MEEPPSLEIELRRDLEELHRWVLASNRADPHSSRAEKKCDAKTTYWEGRLKEERAAELEQAAAENQPAIGARYDRLQRGAKEAIDAIRQGKDPELSFTIPEPDDLAQQEKARKARETLEAMRQRERANERDF